MAGSGRGGKTRGRVAGCCWTWFVVEAIVALAIAARPAAAQRGLTRDTSGEASARPTETFRPPPPPPVFPAANSCGDAESDKMKEVRANDSARVEVACSLTLRPDETITKTIVYDGTAASGATLNCTCDQSACTTLKGGVHVLATSGRGRPENITVRNCKIIGDVKINDPSFTFCTDGIPANCRDKHDNFEEWVRCEAPRRITFDHVTFAGRGHNRLYVGWGVTETKLINSVMEGEATGVPIYLAPSSSRTLIKNNRIKIDTLQPGILLGRETIAIDGSDHNRIISNWFGDLNRGGIYLYRNCGENGSIRHTTPSHNHIVNNVFYYDSYDGSNPAVYLGSRDGVSPGSEDYCHYDEGQGRLYGSAADNRDFATHNVVMQNEVVKRSVAKLNKSRNWVNNAMNLVDHNRTVSQGTWPRPPAGCYVRGGEKEFILHGETTETFMARDGSPSCDKVTCHDSELRSLNPEHDVAPCSPMGATTAPLATTVSTGEHGASLCRTRRVPFDCRVTGDNNGCEQTVSCPAGTTAVGAVAACDLENGAVTDAQLAAVPPHLIHVATVSDHVPSGSCHVESNSVAGRIAGTSVPQVQTPIRGIAGRTRIAVGCKEYDRNGGDCQIRGSLYCR